MENSLQKVIEWDGFFWKTLENEMCTKKIYHFTFVYRGEIYHIGGYKSAFDNDGESNYNR